MAAKTPAPAKKIAKPLPRKDCKIKACTKPAAAKQMCNAHYTAERRKDPVVMEKAREASRRSVAKRKAAAEAGKKATK